MVNMDEVLSEVPKDCDLAQGPGVFRHFKGNYCFVTSINRICGEEGNEKVYKFGDKYYFNHFSVSYFPLKNPSLMYSRDIQNFLSEYSQCSSVDGIEIIPCGKKIVDRWDNATGQSHRFIRVKDFGFPLSYIGTPLLMDELNKRSDSPLRGLDIEQLRSSIKCVEYVVGVFHDGGNGVPEHLEVFAGFTTFKEADSYLRNHYRGNRLVSVYRRTYIEGA